MYSPAAIDNAPASRPASPVVRIAEAFAPAPATPMMRQVLETRPSFTPKTAARRLPPRPTPRCRAPTSETWVGMAWPSRFEVACRADNPRTFMLARMGLIARGPTRRTRRATIRARTLGLKSGSSAVCARAQIAPWVSAAPASALNIAAIFGSLSALAMMRYSHADCSSSCQLLSASATGDEVGLGVTD